MSENRRVQAVLFDYGVVLSGPPRPEAWSRMKQITRLEEDLFHRAYWGPRHEYDRGFYTGSAYWLTAGRSVGVDFSEDVVAALIEADTDLWTGINQPIADWAARLQAAGTRTGILSNLGDSMQAGVLARQPWIRQFDYILWSHSVKLAKPEAAIYALAVEGLGCAANDVLFVDDREDNVAGALAAGLQAVLYTDDEDLERTLTHWGLGELWRTGRLAVTA